LGVCLYRDRVWAVFALCCHAYRNLQEQPAGYSLASKYTQDAHKKGQQMLAFLLITRTI
jgi:hypothetical protein